VSRENVEWVRETYQLLRRGDPRQVLARIAPDATWQPAKETPRRTSDNGRELAQRLVWRATVHRLRATELIDLGDRVLVTLVGRRMQYLGATWWGRRIYQIVTLRDGRISRLEDFRRLDEALESAGVKVER
jgi:ketosteroid isomerase-like protein